MMTLQPHTMRKRPSVVEIAATSALLHHHRHRLPKTGGITTTIATSRLLSIDTITVTTTEEIKSARADISTESWLKVTKIIPALHPSQ